MDEQATPKLSLLTLAVLLSLVWAGAAGAVPPDGNPTPPTHDSSSADRVNLHNPAFEPVISGQVTGGGCGIAGVLVAADSGGRSATTDPNGRYELTVPYDWSGTVTPAGFDLAFEPDSRHYENVIVDQTNQDYTAAAPPPTVLTYRVTSSADDGYVNVIYAYGGSQVWQNLTSDLWLGVTWDWCKTFARRFHSGMRFENVRIPPDAFIKEAHLYLKTAGSGFRAYGQLSAEKADNPPDFNAGNIETRRRTAARVYWSHADWPSDTWFASPDIASILRQVVSRPGWSPGNAIVLLYRNSAGCRACPCGMRIFFHSFDMGKDDAPRLEIVIESARRISGVVLTNSEIAVEQVLVSANNGGRSGTTDANGFYELAVPAGWSGTITPHKSMWGFGPDSRTLDDVILDRTGEDFTAFAPPVISGYVADVSGLPTDGVLVSPDGAGQPDITDADGYYEVAVPYDWSGSVALAKNGWAFEPDERPYVGVTANQPNQDYTAFAPPLISGYVRDSNQQPAAEVLVSATDGTDSDITDASGYYELTVPQAWSGTLAPEKKFCFFEPNQLACENLTQNTPNQNFTAITGVVISGLVTSSSGAAIDAVEVAADNGGYGGVTDTNGFYEFAVLPNWSGTVAPAKKGRSFSPASRAYSNLTTHLTDQNFVSLGLVVRADGNGDFPTIQDAVDEAVDGDQVILEPGTYTGQGNSDIDFGAKAITVRSTEPDNPAIVAATIIKGHAFSFRSGEGPDSVVDGLTVAQGTAAVGGGITCRHSSPTIRNCVIRECCAVSHGGAIALEDSNSTISNCIITANAAVEMGAGIACMWEGRPVIANCLFTGNSVDWAGGAIASSNCDLTMSNCTLTSNKAQNPAGTDGWGAGICIWGGALTITNSILWDNDANHGPEIAMLRANAPSQAAVSYCDVQGGHAKVYAEEGCTLIWDNTSNIDVDPCFAHAGCWKPAPPPPPPPPPPWPPPPPGPLHSDDDDDFWVNGDYHLKSYTGRWKPSPYIGLDPPYDGFINLSDFAAFAGHWCRQGAFLPADLDNNGIVDSFDLDLLFDGYLLTCPLGHWVSDAAISPCIDAGDPHFDWSAESRPNGGRINMGAYGGTPQASRLHVGPR
ncbi:MAG: right-handed parallel beta-helix repeat-containing protein [Phycisphaerales bacterium]|nr:MAG: right-handed parallel beta-helix repeat-containing protein [Phycisphaerales bacterium]